MLCILLTQSFLLERFIERGKLLNDMELQDFSAKNVANFLCMKLEMCPTHCSGPKKLGMFLDERRLFHNPLVLSCPVAYSEVKNLNEHCSKFHVCMNKSNIKMCIIFTCF